MLIYLFLRIWCWYNGLYFSYFHCQDTDISWILFLFSTVLCHIPIICALIYFQLLFGVSIQIISIFYLHSPQNLAKSVQGCCTSLFTTLFPPPWTKSLYSSPLLSVLRVMMFVMGWIFTIYFSRLFSITKSSLTI